MELVSDRPLVLDYHPFPLPHLWVPVAIVDPYDSMFCHRGGRTHGESNRRSFGVILTFLSAVTFVPNCALASPLIVEEISRGEAEDLKSEWARERGRLQPLSRLDGNLLIVPLFIVDTTSPAGLTTLFAVHADPDLATQVTIQYEDPFGGVFLIQTHNMPPSSVLTINIRDKNPPVLAQGLAFGRVVIDANSGRRINGDYYQVDPAGNFAFGDGLISNDDLCLIEDVRYAFGGIFDDTIVNYHFLQLTTPGMAGLPAAVVEIYTEGGSLARTFQLILPAISSRTDLISVAALIDDLGGGPTNGVLCFYWNPDTVGAAVTKASVSAQGRFSVGLQGACRLGLLEVL